LENKNNHAFPLVVKMLRFRLKIYHISTANICAFTIVLVVDEKLSQPSYKPVTIFAIQPGNL
jgi:hypothetical protein